MTTAIKPFNSSQMSAEVQYSDLTGFSPNQAAKFCGVGRTLLYTAISSGELKSSKIGRRRIITLGAIRAWLQANEACNAAR